MAAQVSSIFKLAVEHPVVSSGVFLILLLPAFHVMVYFFPLLISTALCVVALVSIGGVPFLLGDEAEVSIEDSSSWMGMARQKVKAWIRNKLGHSISRSESETDLQRPDNETEELGFKTTSEHEKRVRQLERTLSTLSFVSYEGIFAADDTLLQIDPADEDVDVEYKEIPLEDEEHEDIDVECKEIPLELEDADVECKEIPLEDGEHENVDVDCKEMIPLQGEEQSHIEEQQPHIEVELSNGDLSSWQEVERPQEKQHFS